VTVKLTGTTGAPVKGYYVERGHRVDLNANLPVTLSKPGITLVAVKKVNAADQLSAAAQGKNGSMSMGIPAGQAGGVRLQLGGGYSCEVIEGNESLDLPKSRDERLVIEPYWHDNTWVFDDASLGLEQEPFVHGVPEMIDVLVRDIPNARNGFRLTFSPKKFEGQQVELMWVRAEAGGNVYQLKGSDKQGWVCPALFRYMPSAPKHIYLRADAKPPATPTTSPARS
jgi:hypothetical protein